MGKIIAGLEPILRNCFPKTERGERNAGILLVVLVLIITGGISLLLLSISFYFHLYAGLVVETVICYQMFATRSLKSESMKVFAALKSGDIKKSQAAVSMIVGRDTKHLGEIGITKATVETIAENTSDGVIAPMFYMILFGGVGGVIYKVINTMDSMIGYRNAAYQYFGTAAARLDDAVNWIPARLSAWLMITATLFSSFSTGDAIRIFFRDRYKHKSPNSAQTEAVMAGALGIELAGPASYFGEVIQKPVIGEKQRKIEIYDIKRANRLLYRTAFTGMILFSIIKAGLVIQIGV